MAEEAGAQVYEFQCLHGMGETLYDQVVGADNLDRPCRIYAPVGSHETLLAYLVRRLLENGANSSFVNQIVDPAIGLDELLADPVDAARARRRRAASTHPACRRSSTAPSGAIPPDSTSTTRTRSRLCRRRSRAGDAAVAGGAAARAR